jgi:hypothetical protein
MFPSYHFNSNVWMQTELSLHEICWLWQNNPSRTAGGHNMHGPHFIWRTNVYLGPSEGDSVNRTMPCWSDMSQNDRDTT